MFCKKCGADIGESNFCPDCGIPTDNTVDLVKSIIKLKRWVIATAILLVVLFVAILAVVSAPTVSTIPTTPPVSGGMYMP